MKKLIVACLTIMCVTSYSKDKEAKVYDFPYVIKKKGDPQQFKNITAEPNGRLKCLKGKMTMVIKAGDYFLARVPKNKEIEKADDLLKKKDYKNAASEYLKLYTKYQYIGWDVYCILNEATALYQINEKDQAIKRLKLIKNYDLSNPYVEVAKGVDVMAGYKLLAKLYIEQNKLDDAEKILADVVKAKDDNTAAFALNARGDILTKNGKDKQAILSYLQTILLFPKEVKEERSVAMFKVVQLLKKLKDIRSEVWIKKLKQEYPESIYIKQLQ